MSRRLVILLIAVCVSCKQGVQQAARPNAPAPQTRATVVTIRTTIEPEKTTHVHTIVIEGNRARSTNEHDAWRLFDTKADTVTFVDDMARTVRTEPLRTLATRRRTANASALPPHYPRVTLTRTGEKKQLQGVSAEEWVIRTGTYKRELWLAEHRAIPRNLFAMMHVSEPASTPLAPMMRSVDEALLAARGFPLVDRTELAWADQKMVVERAVVSIEQKNVPAAMLVVPKDYRDLNAAAPRPTPAARK